MKSLPLIATVFGLFLVQLSWARSTNTDWENLLWDQLHSALGNESFSIQSLQVAPSEKRLTGIGTFFKKEGVRFTVSYEGAEEIGSFEATMPSNANISVTHKEFRELAGQRLEQFLPDALQKSVYLEGFRIDFSKKEKKAKSIHLLFNALRNWEFLQGSQVALEQIKVRFEIEHPTEKAKRRTHGILTGLTTIAGKAVALEADLTSRKEELQLSGTTGDLSFQSSLQSLAGRSSIQGIDLPDNLISLELSTATLTFAPYQKWITLRANSSWGEVDMWVQRPTTGKQKETAYLVTISPPEGFRLSQIHANLKALDAIDLSKQKIVLSSEEKSKEETSKIPGLSEMATYVSRGLSMVADLDLRKLGIDHLIGVKNLIVSSPLSSKLEHIRLDAALETNIAFGKTATLKDVIFRLKPAPSNFAVSLLGVMETQVDEDVLIFKGGVELVLSDQTFNFLAMMNGDWNDPLGARGLQVSDLGIQMGASFTTAPVLLPNIALAGKVEIGKFHGSATVAFDARNPTKSMLAAEFNKLILWDLVDALCSDAVEKHIPADLKDNLRSIYFKDVELEAVPVAVQVLDRLYDPGFRAGGKMNFAGFRAEGLFDIDYANGMLAQGSVDPIDLKVFQLEGAAGHERPSLLIDLRKSQTPKFAVNGMVSLLGLTGETDIHILKDGFQFALGGKVFSLFAGKVTARGADMQRAGDMQVQVDLENNFLEFLQKDVSNFVEHATADGISGLRAVQQNLRETERVVQSWDKDIEAKRKEISQKQAKYRSAFEAAQRKVNEAKSEVNKLNKEIASLKKLAASKDKPYELPERTYLEGKIKTVQGLRLGALGALETANLGLEGLKWVNKDPDTDPQVIYLKGKKEAALKTVQVFRFQMEKLEQGLGFGKDMTVWLLEKGTKGVVDIQEASFAGRLGTVSGGAVQLKLKVAWLGKTQYLTVAFDFNDLTKSVAGVGEVLMGL